MGVPGLSGAIVKNPLFEQYVYYFLIGKRIDPYGAFDYLHFDGNAIIHGCTQQAFFYGEEAIGIDPYYNLTQEQRRTKSFELFWNKMMAIKNMYNPKVLNITMDGPAPLAKQNQQRSRRFQALAGAVNALPVDRAKLGRGDGVPEDPKKVPPNKFDSTQISPGTIFMLELTKYLHFQIRKYLNGPGKDTQIFFSSAQVPGEGEHKIMNFIRSLPEEDANKKHLLVGEDGDLIFLTMAPVLPQMHLLRADKYNPRHFYHLAISEITKMIPQDFGRVTATPRTPSPKASPKMVKSAVDDFIFTGFFVGNDFLPMIPMFDVLENGLNQMIDIIHRERLNLIIDGKVNFKDFKVFVEGLAGREEDEIRRDFEKFLYNLQRYPGNDIFRNKTLEPFIDVSRGTLNYQGYRKAYLKKSQIYLSMPEGKNLLKQMCHDYLKTLIWVFVYYTQGLPSWEWYYPWYYAPLMTDFSTYINGMTKKEIEDIYLFDEGKPSKPFVQLLCILPAKGSTSLPVPYRHLMLSPQSPLVEAGFYPKSFSIDLEGKTKEHMGVVLIRMVDDIKLVRKAYEKVAKGDPNNYVRNSVGVDYWYTYDKEMKAYTYRTTTYGSIRECYVKVDQT
jgi:5'-3' exonuclease